MKVDVFVWKASNEQLKILGNILKVIKNQADCNIEFKVNDLYCVDANKTLDNPVIKFGAMCDRQISSSEIPIQWSLTELKKIEDIPENKEHRKNLYTQLLAIGDELAKYNSKNKDKVEASVELDDKTTIGVGVGDIQLTESEVSNLLKIKKLLNGSTVVLTKGDIRIEVKE